MVKAGIGPRRQPRGLQAAGMTLPILMSSPAAVMAGAALFGGTFMGVVTLAMAAARRIGPLQPGRTVGSLAAGAAAAAVAVGAVVLG